MASSLSVGGSLCSRCQHHGLQCVDSVCSQGPRHPSCNSTHRRNGENKVLHCELLASLVLKRQARLKLNCERSWK